MNTAFVSPAFLSELMLTLWLLIKGICLREALYRREGLF